MYSMAILHVLILNILLVLFVFTFTLAFSAIEEKTPKTASKNLDSEMND